jgi:hypothetical protein
MPRKDSSKEQTSSSVDDPDIDMDDFDYDDDSPIDIDEANAIVEVDPALRARRQLEILREERELQGILDDYGDWQKRHRRGNNRKQHVRKNNRARHG